MANGMSLSHSSRQCLKCLTYTRAAVIIMHSTILTLLLLSMYTDVVGRKQRKRERRREKNKERRKRRKISQSFFTRVT